MPNLFIDVRNMQLDETTDVSQCSQLLVFVCYMHADAIKEEFLFCEPLLESTKAIDILEMVNSFFAKQNFDWKKNLGTLCTNGAPAMLGTTSGFAALVKKEAPQVIVTHCFLHRHVLASKTLPAILKEVLSTDMKVVNFIRARAVNHRVFKRFSEEMGAEYEVLLYHTEVRWLSRGQILKRLVELRAEVSLFLREKESPLSVQFDSEEFIHGLAYFADIFGHMNEVEFCRHLETLQNSFKGYFCSGDLKVETWIRNPFLAEIDCISDEDLAKDDLIDLKKKEKLRNEFNSKSLGEFWCALTQAYPRLESMETAVNECSTFTREGYVDFLAIFTKPSLVFSSDVAEDLAAGFCVDSFEGTQFGTRSQVLLLGYLSAPR
ncbi:protein ZBED8-like [Homarus americanus]|uniref:protein ZBED8-like n=1 Tax=Homarus americanus TaxID=6706 RepID=UPI001C4489BA|nr:protein ZBED8-like [Homarus americanus]